MALAGPAEAAARALRAVDLPPASAQRVLAIAELVAAVARAVPGLAVTVDPGEHRGFAYQSDFGFTLLSDEVRGEIGRGGRYGIRRPGGAVEPAAGFTLYLEGLAQALPAPGAPSRILAPPGATGRAEELRRQGHVVVANLEADMPDDEAAAELGFTHVLRDGKVQPLG